jgi:superfamily II DNA/RNA helicase
VAEAKRRLEESFTDRDQRVDCALATNMISVGLDITRLGLMVITNQPKTHSEYIQASSRVGRDSKKPGLVLALLNIHRPRDRSHYERFRHYHETFYRSVEASSVTPFSARALDRGLAGAFVGWARHADPALTPAGGPGAFPEHATELRQRAIETFQRRVERAVADPEDAQERSIELKERIEDLVDSWLYVVQRWSDDKKKPRYQQYEGKGKDTAPLVREMMDDDFASEHHRKFRANRSLRDVETQVQVELYDYDAKFDEQS